MIIHKGLLKTLSIQKDRVDFSADDILIFTEDKTYMLSEMECSRDGEQYVYKSENAEFKVLYRKVENTAFITRALEVCFTEDTVLYKIGVRLPCAEEQFMYNTFYNASAAVFSRNGNIGFCCGFENPFCILEGNLLYFEPSLLLKKDEIFECDLNFYGVYDLWGEKINPALCKSQIYVNGRYHPRYRNPSEGIPLYFSEIFAFNTYTAKYFESEEKKFKFMTYDFFGNLPQRPETEEDCTLYLQHIDAVAEIGCDTILLNPLFPNQIPDRDENSFWELFPEGTYAETILNYARKKGLKVGVYTGTAGNGQHGNSPLIGYVDEVHWKKIDIKGKSGEENCIADDSFLDWYIKVQVNTIKKYKLDVWSWDPGPGNGFFCHNKKHGHLPGKGAYKGFRNSIRVMKAIKEAVPDLYYQGFHGNKEYGLWGFKYIDQHEGFWENEVYVMNPVFDDLSVDRVTANNIRQQSTWNYYFRFMPASLNHGIAHRMIQSNWMGLKDLDLVFDYTGWKYALLSSVAYGGPITLTIVPREPEKINEYINFYKKWIRFAKEIFPYSTYTIPIGEQVGCGIDAVSKIKDNEGYVFLFNPFPKDYKTFFHLDKRINVSDDMNRCFINMIYPYTQSMGEYFYGEKVETVIPAYSCIILKVSAEKEDFEDAVVLRELPRVLNPGERREYVFKAYAEIKELLQRQEVNAKGVQEQKVYAEKFDRVNSCWNRPDRLWLFVKTERPCKNAKLYLNGKKVNWQQDVIAHNELMISNMVFADITDTVVWDTENTLFLTGFNEQDVYLNYPRSWNEKMPDEGFVYEKKDFCAPLQSEKINVETAIINSDNRIIPNTENTLTVKVNIPHEKLEGVYASVPISIGATGNELRRDMALEYKNGIWCKTFMSGKRIHLIIDDCKISIWAVSKDKKESKTYYLPIEWMMREDDTEETC